VAGRRHLATLLGSATLFAALITGFTLYGAERPKPCETNEVNASISNGAASGAGLDRMTIVLVGDAGFNASDAEVDAKGWRKERKVTPFADMTSGIAKDIDGDLAFVNIETVVTDRNDLKPERKGSGDKDAAFHFRSHPAAVKTLISLGFNLFSLANNHAADYGAAGIEETLYHLAVANTEHPIAFAGIGSTFEEAINPACLDLGGTRIGFGAIGIITGDDRRFRATGNSAGQASYRDRADFEAVVNKLVALPADYRILSIHYGLEGRVVPDDRQIKDWRDFAAGEKKIDLIVGHHAHVAQGVELNGTSLVFYGLGNFLHPGTTEMSRFGPCRDYGLMAKVHLAHIGGAWRVEAIEAIPLANTQTHPERFAPKEAELRIEALNHLAAGLDDPVKGGKGVRFTPQSDGSGLYCAEGAAALGGKIGTLCKDWLPAAEAMKPVADKIEKACADKPFYSQPSLARRRIPPRRDFAPSPFPFGGLRQF
jgi:poly-gamma-glutamate synthesis protein (capsule biosynthesis protein)